MHRNAVIIEFLVFLLAFIRCVEKSKLLAYFLQLILRLLKQATQILFLRLQRSDTNIIKRWIESSYRNSTSLILIDPAQPTTQREVRCHLWRRVEEEVIFGLTFGFVGTWLIIKAVASLASIVCVHVKPWGCIKCFHVCRNKKKNIIKLMRERFLFAEALNDNVSNL